MDMEKINRRRKNRDSIKRMVDFMKTVELLLVKASTNYKNLNFIIKTYTKQDMLKFQQSLHSTFPFIKIRYPSY